MNIFVNTPSNHTPQNSFLTYHSFENKEKKKNPNSFIYIELGFLLVVPPNPESGLYIY